MSNVHHKAIEYIETYVKNKYPTSKDSLTLLCQQVNIDLSKLDFVINQIKSNARICLHFHPYRLNEQGVSMIELLLQTGIYKSQFETKISNGSLSAHKGGDRDIWENNLFGQVYAAKDAPMTQRPKYGALDLLRHADGPASRFGSCYFVLNSALKQAATFTYLDSYKTPHERGTINALNIILVALIQDCLENKEALGEETIEPVKLVDKISRKLSTPYLQTILGNPKQNLDQYIEAQVHADINLEKDVAILVADSAYQNTPIERSFKKLCEKYQIALLWRQGLELTMEAAMANFRGTKIPDIVHHYTINDNINVAMLAAIEKQLTKELKNKAALNIQLQQLKYLYHTLVQFGKPI